MTHRAFWLTAWLVVTASAPAHANEREEAEALMKAGTTCWDQADFNCALRHYREAYARYPAAQLLVNMASTLKQLGRYAEAADVYERYLSDPTSDPAYHDRVAALVDELDEKVGRLTVVVKPNSASVRLDEQALPASRWAQHRVDVGEHTLTASAPGHADTVRRIHISAGQRLRVALVLAPPLTIIRELPAAAPQPLSTSEMTGATLLGLGGLSLVGGGVATGFHLDARTRARDHCTSSVCDPTGHDATNQANVAGQVGLPLMSAGGALVAGGLLGFLAPADDTAVPVSVWTMAGTGAGAAGIGLILGLVGRTREAELRNDCAPVCSSSDVLQVQRQYAAADAAFGVSLASLGAAAALLGAWLATPEDDELPIRAAADHITVSF